MACLYHTKQEYEFIPFTKSVWNGAKDVLFNVKERTASPRRPCAAEHQTPRGRNVRSAFACWHWRCTCSHLQRRLRNSSVPAPHHQRLTLACSQRGVAVCHIVAAGTATQRRIELIRKRASESRCCADFLLPFGLTSSARCEEVALCST